MITIQKEVLRTQKNFWNNCLFHPTDAVEDPWGRKVLDRMANDGAIKTVRIYTMLEDIVYLDENGNLAYDFRLNDLRLDYLTEKGYDILLAYGMMPECIASNLNAKSCVSKNKTRYKGKLINTSPPTDYKLWEEICYTYTKHIVERYGIDVVSKWHLQCLNEPDHEAFFMSDQTDDMRVKEYCKLYTAFARGIQRASTDVCFGGPAIAYKLHFLADFLDYIKENDVRLDFISLHNYAGNGADRLNQGKPFMVEDWLEKQQEYFDVIEEHGFAGTKVIVDEWGMAAQGFFNIEECPAFIARETEIFSSYYVKLISKILERGWNISNLLICLSGQHEMVTDFSGFRNFFTLNFFAKPIYNAYVLASKLREGLLSANVDNENIFVIPTKSADGKYAVLLTYSAEHFDENLEDVVEEIVFEENIKGKQVTIFCIDKNTTNPYRLYEKMHTPEVGEGEIKLLREEGTLKPVLQFIADDNERMKLNLTANSVCLIEVM